MSAPCQMKCRSAQPIACASGWCSSGSIAVIALLLLGAGAVQDLPDFTEFVGRRPLGGQRLQHQLRRRPAEGAFDQVADQLTLRLLLAQAGAVDVRAIALVT